MMTHPIFIAVLVVLSLGLLALAFICVRLAQQQQCLKQDLVRINNRLTGSQQDLAGLCSAALTVDERVAVTEEELKLLWSRLSELAAQPAAVNQLTEHPYQSVIQKVRSGASVSELMQSAGLSHDEAALLIRLHGQKSSP